MPELGSARHGVDAGPVQAAELARTSKKTLLCKRSEQPTEPSQSNIDSGIERQGTPVREGRKERNVTKHCMKQKIQVRHTASRALKKPKAQVLHTK